MDEEQAHRMAAAEALCLISTRVDKTGLVQKLSARGRKKRITEYALADTTTKNGIKDCLKNNSRDTDNDNNGLTINNSSSERRESYEGRGGINNGTVKRGRGSRGRGSSPRGRGGGKSTSRGQNKSADDTPRSNIANKKLGQEDATRQRTKSSSNDRASRRTRRTKSGTKVDNTDISAIVANDKLLVQAIGFTGATITCMSEPTPKRKNSNAVEQSQSLANQELKQMNLPAGKLPSTTPSYNLPSINLASFTPDVNLPSLPLEIGSLQLSSQPTPNLSSWGDLAEGLMENDSSSADRKKMEKFLPLKKRKHHSSSEADIKETALPPETVLSESEDELSECSSPPPQAVEPLRASFTVQAPPIITMQTLMEIKTALTPDDDGDLPLHIAVVHENMRMVIKLINLMRIAGKGVDKFNKQQQTPLHLAVKLNFMEAIDILLKSNANVNAVDCTGSSCVHMAVQGKSNQCLTMLLERCPNADLNMRNFDGLTPLHIAVDNGDLQQVETLLKYNTDIDVTDGKSGRSALFRAAESNQKSMVEVLLNKGANPDIPNYAGVTTAMAAQGRNLHGVLKLLGAVASEKVVDIDMKPAGLALEVKPAVTYLCYSSGDAVPLSHPSVTKGVNSAKQNVPALTCVVAPKVNAEKVAEFVSVDETKVFQNVFVMLPDRKSGTRLSHSKSEPSSPEVKIEVVEAKEGETTATRLLSLPEGLLSSSEVSVDRQPTAQPKRVTQGDTGRSLTGFETKPKISVSNPQNLKSTRQYLMGSSHNLVRMELTSSPSFTKTTSILAGTVVSPPVIVSSTTADVLRSVRSTGSEAGGVVSPVGSVTLPSSSTSDTSVTLTSHQARLFQMLLKMYNIDPSNQAAAPSANKIVTSSSPKVALSTPILPFSSLSSTTAASNSSSIPKNPASGILSQLYPNQQKRTATAGFARSSCESTNGEVGSCVEPASFSQQKLLKVHGNSYNYIQDGRRVIGSQPVRLEESPLNLTTASRQTTLVDTVSDDSCKKHSNLTAADSSSDTSSIQFGARAEQSPAQKMKQTVLVPPGVSRVADVVIGREEDLDDAHVEVYVKYPLPSGKATFPVKNIVASTVAVFGSSPSLESNEMLCSSRGLSPGSMELKLTPLHQQPDFSSKTTGVSKKTASIVKDYLSNQNQFLRSQSLSPSMSSLLSVPISPRHFSGQSILDLPKEPDNSLQQKLHVICESKNVPSVTGEIHSMDDINTLATTSVLTTVSSSPVYLDQGHAIDLSVGRAAAGANRKLSSAVYSQSSANSQSELTRVIGFSGAILSVPPKLERPDKRGPREVAPKESKKRRGRKSQKEAQAAGVVTDINKINSETDQKLKQFLGAKKVENVTLLHNPNLIFCADSDQSSGMDTHEGHADAGCDAHTNNLDTTFTTVGIFSGNLQRVKVSKKASVPSSPVDSPKVSLSFNSLGSLDSTLLDQNFHGRPALSVEEEAEQIKIYTVTQASPFLTSPPQSNSCLSTLGMSASDHTLTNSYPGSSEHSSVQGATLLPGTNITGGTVLSGMSEADKSQNSLLHKEGHQEHLVCPEPDSSSAASGPPVKRLSTPPKKRRRKMSASENLLQTFKSAAEVSDELTKSPILSNDTGQRKFQKRGHESCNPENDIQAVESIHLNSPINVQLVGSISGGQKDVQVVESVHGSQQDFRVVGYVSGSHE